MPEAVRVAAELRESLGTDPELIEGSGGVFEVIVNGKTIFSKDETGRFPNPGEFSVR